MTVAITPFLKKTLLLDAAVSGAAAVLMAAGAGLLGPLLDLPVSLLFWAGIALFPFVGLLVVMARRETAPRLVLLDIVLINVLWVAASFAIMIAGIVSPNVLGVVFISAQALTVALFAALQFSGLRAAGAEAAA
ncbi:hypothetical protein [Aquamicrobium sp. LC103]|uniref:hypothetical protein n=1 Tax=Aquamicrobium sp. LC103 TaxID=1120658 RepID=UPI00063EA50C|nr:hypothetical protein [Aquamicrobium sp. LC103]TKT81255.1 hypothetical protein XW59_005140 [Aquamicrobium sp. LC103]